MSSIIRVAVWGLLIVSVFMLYKTYDWATIPNLLN